MKETKTSTFFIRALACSALCSGTVHGGEISLTEFDGNESPQLQWQVVNDGVMGGLSKGKISVSDSGMLTFNGNLSLENNGGFSSIRTEKVNLDLSAADGLSARVRGDGRSYQMRLGTDARYRGMEISFMAEFPTEKDKWITVNVPFENFTGSFRGMKLKNEVLDPAKIRRLGLLLGDKKTGPFELQIDWIRSYEDEVTSNSLVDTALADGRFKTLAAALSAAELMEVLQGKGPFTVFAPTDEAFAKLPDGTVDELLKPENRDKLKAILTYHVLPGEVKLSSALAVGQAATVQGKELTIAFSDGRVRVNEASVLNADIPCSNGVIHVVDSVLLPPSPEVSNDLLGIAKRSGKFSTLLAALDAAGLTSVLSDKGPLTILAPTDEAFAALPSGTVESLLKKENREQLVSILTYHAFAGDVSAGDAINAGSADTLNGKPVTFAIKEGLLQANGATIRKVDLTTSNGRLHVIDAVLLPPGDDSKKAAKATENPTSPLLMIEEAISQGVPIFNEGDHDKCAAIYRDCLVGLSKSEQVTGPMKDAIKMLLKRGDQEQSATARAWAFRHGLDIADSILRGSHD